MLLIFTLAGVYGFACVASFRRCGWFGLLALALLVASGAVLQGTWAYVQPHAHVVPIGRNHWQCDSLTELPMLVVLTVAAAVALAATELATLRSWKLQLAAVGIAFAGAIAPALVAELHFLVQVWGCDTV